MVTIDFDRLNIKPGARVLDMGCGPGRHTAAVYRLKDVTIVGADLDLPDLLKARDRMMFHQFVGAYDGGSWALTVSDITNMPFKDRYFDVVICSEVLEHIPDDKKALSELVRVVKPGGDLVVSVPRYVPEKICWMLSDEYNQVNQGHIRIYRQPDVEKMLDDAGVTLWDTHFAHGIHTPYWWLRCLTGPTREDVTAVHLYKRFLDWDTIKQPKLSRTIDTLLNPLIGKSVVFYTRKE